jgi:hypothetical protein
VTLEPVVGVVVPATVATVIREETLGAVNELLGSHDDLVVASEDEVRLNGFSSGEGPA